MILANTTMMVIGYLQFSLLNAACLYSSL
jgi:hypothetical protein